MRARSTVGRGRGRGRRAGAPGIVALALLVPACAFDLPDVGGSGGGAPAAADPSKSIDPNNLTKNPSFEISTDGWAAQGANVNRETRADAPNGCCVAKVIYNGAPSSSPGAYYGISDASDAVSASVANATYSASAWVRSAIMPLNPGAEVNIIIQEKGLGDIAASARVKLGASWVKLEASGVAMGGHGIDVHVSQYNPAAGDAFYIDLFQLTEKRPSGG